MAEEVDIPAPPALPLATPEYSPQGANALTNVLRLFFNRVISSMRTMDENTRTPTLLSFTPTTEPTSASAGDVYYDSGTNKLRCYNGTTWNDLF